MRFISLKLVGVSRQSLSLEPNLFHYIKSRPRVSYFCFVFVFEGGLNQDKYYFFFFFVMVITKLFN